jgi:hypothetical protein
MVLVNAAANIDGVVAIAWLWVWAVVLWSLNNVGCCIKVLWGVK